MSKRKTMAVTDIVDIANRYLELPDHEMHINDDFRHGVMAVLEHVLHRTENYRGFRYQPSERAEEPPFAPGTTYLRPGYNETRRLYYHPSS